MKRVFATLAAVLLVLAMVMPVYAAPCVDSPGPVPPIHVDPSGDDTLKFIVTPYSGRASAPHTRITKLLTEDMVGIKAAPTIKSLCPGLQNQLTAIQAKSTDEAVKALTLEDYIIDKLFNGAWIKNNTQYVTCKQLDYDHVQITFDTNYKENTPVLVMYNPDVENRDWQPLDYTLEKNGHLTVVIEEVGDMSFLVPLSYVDPEGRSHQTGDMTTGIIAAAAITSALIVCLGTCVLVDKKRA